MMSGDIGKAFLEVIALNSSTIVAIIGAVVSFIAWTMMGDSMFRRGPFGFGLAAFVLGFWTRCLIVVPHERETSSRRKSSSS